MTDSVTPSERAMEAAREYMAQPLAEIERCGKGTYSERMWAGEAAPTINKAVDTLARLIARYLKLEREE